MLIISDRDRDQDIASSKDDKIMNKDEAWQSSI